MCVCVNTCDGTHVDARGQLIGVRFIPAPKVSPGNPSQVLRLQQQMLSLSYLAGSVPDGSDHHVRNVSPNYVEN